MRVWIARDDDGDTSLHYKHPWRYDTYTGATEWMSTAKMQIPQRVQLELAPDLQPGQKRRIELEVKG